MRRVVQLAAVAALLGRGTAFADGTDPRVTARRLAAGVAPLGATASGITRDIGNISVIEHDGSAYDRDNVAARAAVAQRFYASHGDNYDVLVVFTNFDFETGQALAFHNVVRNDVRGIGLSQIDNGSFFGAPGRLRGFVDMAAVNRYRALPQSLATGTPGFVRTLNVVAHEMAHQWLSRVRYRDASGSLSSELLGQDGSHWSYLLDSDASLMYGSRWTPRSDGRFEATQIEQGYSSLDLYLMGLLDPAKVPPFTLLRNDAIDRTLLPREGDIVAATAETVTVDQVIAAEGARTPSFLESPKEFRVAFILLTAPGADADPADLQALENVRRAFPSHFFALTRGVAIADTSLAEVPPLAHSAFPDLDRALSWLLSAQSLDGRFEDAALTNVRDTSAASDALLAAGVTGVARERALAFLGSTNPVSVDYFARRAMSLASSMSEAERRSAARTLLNFRNPDGGFGAGLGFATDPLDTALALRALRSLDWPADSLVVAAVQVLAGSGTSAGWTAVTGARASSFVTAHVVLALQDWKDVPAAAGPAAIGVAALTSRQNPDGGFGESPSNPYATAIALQALLRGGAPSSVTDAAIGWLQAEQLADGSWRGGRYPTALVLDALKGGTSPNLVVPADGIVITPATVDEGQQVSVSARVSNQGRTAAGASQAALYDGSPASGERIGTATVPALEAGASATVTFAFSSQDRAGSRTLYVAADPDDEVRESREDDNVASRALQVSGRLPDLVVLPGDLTATPAPAEEGETVTLIVRVTNRGERRAPASRTWLFDGAPGEGGVLLGEAAFAALEPGTSAATTLSWRASERREHEIFAVADAIFGIPESDEANNVASVRVLVSGVLGPGADLELPSLQLSPPSLSSLPQTITMRAVVRNLGRDRGASTVRFDTEPPGVAPLAELTVDLAGRSSTTLVAQGIITTPGGRTIVARADPDQALTETNEENNAAFANLEDPGNTFDVQVLAAAVRLSSSDLVAGEELTVEVAVVNHGTAPITGVPVVLETTEPGNQHELARQIVTVAPGAEVSVSLSWRASIVGDAVPLRVRADPFDLLHETNEADNEVAFSVKVRPSSRADLAVVGGDIGFDPDPPREGLPAAIRVRVRNLSGVDAGPFVVRTYLGDPAQDARIAEVRVTGLAAHAETLVELPWTSVAVRGLQGVFAVIDADGEVDEYDETNNQTFRAFGILGLPDLVLTAGDIVLQPAYPRAGEPVTVRATLHNLGGQSASNVRVRALEGAPTTGTPIAEATIDNLEPTAAGTVEFTWTPAAPPGERTLSVVVDPEGAILEQSEGNNQVQRSVLVQDANLFLTAPYFSPNGDGVLDETTLGYRSTGTVKVLVSDARGQQVRNLGQGLPSEGSVTWDGRGEDGRVQRDGTYTLTLEGAGATVLGRAFAVLDTNRSPIHDAAGTGLVAVQQMTAQLPEVSGLAWMTGEDEALTIVEHAQGEFAPGLVRVGLDGSYSYVVKDDWFGSGVEFAAAGAVAPDGQEVLLRSDGGSTLWAVNLNTGQRRLVGFLELKAGLAWSPDGDRIAAGSQLLLRDGTLIAQLGTGSGIPNGYDIGASWSWSPDGRFLAAGNTLVSRDGDNPRTIEIPPDVLVELQPCESDLVRLSRTVWRGDGKIHAVVDGCPDRGLLIDPDAGTIVRHPIANGQWSPDGSRVLYPDFATNRTVVALQDGSSPLPLVSTSAQASPGGTLAFYGCSGCPEPDHAEFEFFAVRNLLNLTAELKLVRLPGDVGLLLKGIVADRNFDHYQIDYAEQAAPDVYRPIGAASEIPVLDDVLTVWAPPRPGTYLLRLRAYDRAGNQIKRVQVVSWEHTPVLADFTQDEFLISPTGDGVKDAVTFQYLVQEPTHVEVRIVPVDENGEGAPVRRLSLDHPQIGPASFVWDGRDEAGSVVADGKYTVFVNGLPLRIEVDTTPPDIGWAYQNLRSETLDKVVCTSVRPAGVVSVDVLSHVFDAHLRRWSAPGGGESNLSVYVPDTDEQGRVILEQGRPRVRRTNGRIVDRLETSDGAWAARAGTSLVAEDYAGNRSVFPVAPLAERLFLLEGYQNPCTVPPILPPVDTKRVYSLKPESEFVLGPVLRGPSYSLRLDIRARGNTSWTSLALGGATAGIDFPARGFPSGPVYEGRFVATSATNELSSEDFAFRLVDGKSQLEMTVGHENIPGSNLARYEVEVFHRLGEPIQGASLRVLGLERLSGYAQDVPLTPRDAESFTATFVGPQTKCDCPDSFVLRFLATLKGVSGRTYGPANAEFPECEKGIDIELDEERFCGSPDRLPLLVTGGSAAGASLATIDRGPVEPKLLLGEVTPGSKAKPAKFSADVTGVPEGDVVIRGRLSLVGGGTLAGCTLVERTFFVDRTPPEAEMPLPVEGTGLCVSADPATGREIVRLVVIARDREDGKVGIVAADFRHESGAWTSLLTKLTCLGSSEECATNFPMELKQGAAIPMGWDVTGLPGGSYTLRLTFCDIAGNKSIVERHIQLLREPPHLMLREKLRPVFSPNGDDRVETTGVAVELVDSARLTLSVRAGAPNGPVVRTLLNDQTVTGGRRSYEWDGRDGGGTPVPDGLYVLLFSARDACGRSVTLPVPVEVDTTPPLAQITDPVPPANVASASIDVLGVATDAHFTSYEISVGLGAAPTDWTVLATREQPVPSPGFLAHWDVPAVSTYTIRIVARDSAGNVTDKGTTIDIAPRRYLARLAPNPQIFSPNGDGRRDTTSLEYDLTASAIVRLQVKDAGGVVLKTLESGVPHDPGRVAFSWNGLTDQGTPAPEGALRLAIHLDDAAGIGGPEDTTVSLVLDRTPPTVTIAEPTETAVVVRATSVKGSIQDANLESYSVSVSSSGAPLQPLASGNAERLNADLASLAALPDGPTRVSVSARDLAENESTSEVRFKIDSLPPTAVLHAPASVAARDAGPLHVRATVEDEQLAEYELDFGAGASPGAFVPITRGALTGRDIEIGRWSVAGLLDGLYTLRLRATDRAGQQTETRRSVTLDGTPPYAAIQTPAADAYVSGVVTILGSALDESLEAWDLDVAPGTQATAFQWASVAHGTSPSDEQELAAWHASDGVHTLRLTVRDKVGHITTVFRTVTVDTTPPSAPMGLRSDLRQETAELVLRWNPNPEPDLAGYRLRRGGELIVDSLQGVAFTEANLDEGAYDYALVALDKAGNESAPVNLHVRFDVTPPLALIQSPQADAPVSGEVDIRGSAFSSGDFKEYRLLIGVGDSPPSFTVLKRSTLPVAGSSLGSWTAFGSGSRVIALEAEDLSGNQSRVSVRVVVDSVAPEAPILTDVASGASADVLVPTWSASPASDVAGYLVERNGRIANAPALVLGNLRGYLVPGPSYSDAGLPDGTHCYAVSALDLAGNRSQPSNSICRTLDNRAPHADLVEPPAGLRFEHPIRLIAQSVDGDLASVQFQIRASGSSTWSDLGPADGAKPFEATFDPEGRSYGSYVLRAVATDVGGRSDATPTEVEVVYGDATPPAVPTGPRAITNGADVVLSWAANAETDLAGYFVIRDGERWPGPAIPQTTFFDAGRELGRHVYQVVAADADGNESRPSAPAEALVQIVEVDPPFPVTLETTAAFEGRVATPGTLHAIRDGAEVAMVETADGTFRFAAVPLASGVNLVTVYATDSIGNVTLPSEEVVIISNQAPPALTDVTAERDGHDAVLAWTPSAEADVAGTVVERDSARLTKVVAQTQADGVFSTPWITSPTFAFDGDPETAWIPFGLPASWALAFPQRVLVQGVRIRFAEPPDDISYRIAVDTPDRTLVVAVQKHGASSLIEHMFPTSILTDVVRVNILSAGRAPALAEVEILKVDAVPAGTSTFRDAVAPDGTHRYAVAAIDDLGAVGAFASVDLDIPRVAPQAPTGLQAAVQGSTVSLSWGPNPEPDLARYAVLRDGVRLGETEARVFVDPDLANGTFAYTVLAIDTAGLGSAPSASVVVEVAVQVRPPTTPVIVAPASAAHPATLESSTTMVRGFADAGTLVSLDVGSHYGGTAFVESCPSLVEMRELAPPASFNGGVISHDGGTIVFRWYDASQNRNRLTQADVHGGAGRDVSHPGASNDLRGLDLLSPGGGFLAYVAFTAEAPQGGLYLLEVTSGARRLVDAEALDELQQAFSPDAGRLAFAVRLAAETQIRVYDVSTGTTTIPYRGSAAASPLRLRWSPDGERILFTEDLGGGAPGRLRILELASGSVTDLSTTVRAFTQPDWSPDGARVVYTGSNFQVTVQDVFGSAARQLGNGLDPRFDDSGNRISFVDFATGGLAVYELATDLRSTLLDLAFAEPLLHHWTSDGILALGLPGRVAFFGPCSGGQFEIPGVALQPGENVLVARSLALPTGMLSADSEPALVTVELSRFPDLVVEDGDLSSSPGAPLVSQAGELRVRVRNVGGAASGPFAIRVALLRPDGTSAHEERASLDGLQAGEQGLAVSSFTIAAAGSYTFVAEADPDGLVNESHEENNVAARPLVVSATAGIVARLELERNHYPANSAVLGRATVVNAGLAWQGDLTFGVRDPAGNELAVLEQRTVSLANGDTLVVPLTWNTGSRLPGRYSFHAEARETSGTIAAAVQASFDVDASRAATARLLPEQPSVVVGSPMRFSARVENTGANVPLAACTLGFRVRSSGAIVFEASTGMPLLLPGGVSESVFVWPASGPAGTHTAELRVLSPEGETLAESAVAARVVPPAADVVGGLSLLPAQVLAGAPSIARAVLRNPSSTAISGLPIRVEVSAGVSAQLLVSVEANLDLAPNETRSVDLTLPTTSLSPGSYPAFLRTGFRSLDRATLTVHAALTAPSVFAPADGATVTSERPLLEVNNAGGPPDLPLVYEFEVFADAALQQQLPGNSLVAEGSPRTVWALTSALAEDRTYYWRARASDGFSSSPWTAVASFTVDAQNLPPSSPVIDSPPSGAVVASREPALTIQNAFDPELAHLGYEFVLARDPALTDIVATAADVPETFGLTTWTPPLTLEEDVTYYWRARASDGANVSPWTETGSFTVHSTNAPPTAAVPVSPVGGSVPTKTPQLVVANASDPEEALLAYRFQIDRVPTFDSPALQTSTDVPEMSDTTAWTPPNPLSDNTLHYWRAAAFDGEAQGPWSSASFLVNVANEPPSTPVPSSPASGEVVVTATPTLRVRNAVDPDGDVVRYDFEVRDAQGALVAQASALAEAPLETEWTVDVPLRENATFFWAARASDGAVSSAWSVPQSLRVNAVADPPTAPVRIAPTEGAVVTERRPTLVVRNATSPDGRSLTYAFEVYRSTAAGDVLVDSSAMISEGADSTSFTLGVELADGAYRWRARAHDGIQAGPWMPTARFTVSVDVPPQPPTGLTAVPGDARVQLTWQPSAEPDVTHYRVYRSPTHGGPYTSIGDTASAAFLDTGRTNGVTVFYVVTALDAAFESAYSSEAAATPRANSKLAAEIRFDPTEVAGECLLDDDDDHHDNHGQGHADDDHDHHGNCPSQLRATVELPAGFSPGSIDYRQVRFAGSIVPRSAETTLTDVDHDGIPERRLVFRFKDVAPLLVGGANTLRVTGSVAGSAFEGEAVLLVRPLTLELRITPETLVRHSSGGEVRARLELSHDLRPNQVDLSSLRLMGVIKLKRVVEVSCGRVVVDFDRAQVLAMVPNGSAVPITLTGRVLRFSFQATDKIKVKD